MAEQQQVGQAELQALRAELMAVIKEVRAELGSQIKDGDEKNAQNIKDAQIGLARLERDIGTGMVSKEFLELKLSPIIMAIQAASKDTQNVMQKLIELQSNFGQQLTEIQQDFRTYQREQRDQRKEDEARREALQEKDEQKRTQQTEHQWSRRDKVIAWIFGTIGACGVLISVALGILNYIATHH